MNEGNHTYVGFLKTPVGNWVSMCGGFTISVELFNDGKLKYYFVRDLKQNHPILDISGHETFRETITCFNHWLRERLYNERRLFLKEL